ncbi:MAG TPA: twin-arginine translocase TatA/TatE family subunit [Novosphingobium sp.]|nr:twin-arginine translocase TatA/TatE family subunit [Novosphingobium sp.]
MGFGSLWHWIIVLLVVLVLFGRGRISEIMGDFGKGIKSFKSGLNDDDTPAPPPPAQITQHAPPAAEAKSAAATTSVPAEGGSASGGN